MKCSILYSLSESIRIIEHEDGICELFVKHTKFSMDKLTLLSVMDHLQAALSADIYTEVVNSVRSQILNKEQLNDLAYEIVDYLEEN